MLKAVALALALLTTSTLFAEDGWTPLFDGKSLTGWTGNPVFWSVQEGVILGKTTAESPTEGNTFLVYNGSNKKGPAEFDNFELKAEFRITGHNSGIQYRSFLLPDAKCPGGKNDGWRVGGYQADIDVTKNYVGLNYGEKFRGILAPRGQRVTVVKEEVIETPKGRKGQLVTEVQEIGDNKELATKVKDAPEWNEYHIIANNWTLTQKINGVLMSELIDLDKKNRRSTGLIAIQLHQGPPMTIEVRNIRIKKLEP